MDYGVLIRHPSIISKTVLSVLGFEAVQVFDPDFETPLGLFFFFLHCQKGSFLSNWKDVSETELELELFLELY